MISAEIARADRVLALLILSAQDWRVRDFVLRIPWADFIGPSTLRGQTDSMKSDAFVTMLTRDRC
jgi:hypothetical protein